LFATGTSCLEGAQLGVPSVLVDPSFTVYPDTYRFTWLYERRDYSLGEFVNDSIGYNRGHTITDLIEAINSVDVGTLCKEYTELNHNQDDILNELDDAISRAQYTLRELYTDPEYWRIEFWNPFSRILANCFYQFDTDFSSLEDLLSQIQKDMVREGRKKLAIYGSGGHTEKLIQYLRPVDGLEFVALLDSNPIKHGKWYFDLPVMSITDAVNTLGVDCVLISSLSFEEEIFKENENYCNDNGIKIQKLYGYEDYRFSTMIWDIIGY
jgi:hypothetical protein